MSTPKVPVSIVDRNGKHTTVHRNVSNAPVEDRVSKLRVHIPFSGVTVQDRRDIDVVTLRTIASTTRKAFNESAISIEFEVGDTGNWVANRVTDVQGNDLWNQHNDSPIQDVDDLERLFSKVKYDAAVDEGLVKDNRDGSFTVDFSHVESNSASPSIAIAERNQRVAEVLRDYVRLSFPTATELEFRPSGVIDCVRLADGTQIISGDTFKYLGMIRAFTVQFNDDSAVAHRLLYHAATRGNRRLMLDNI